ncbi:3-keto-disaccharide hydrolase [Sediminicola luteus]|uniref:3-keto-alpha-glucoside-1,2-lyase/3-keto-2-hydroxy-glucal hydratase domain-containing protein n=1 Tax=Sediminicola luteus TaxID=319238 RepID=A0A2A4G9L7_9FLAO|nr:DUF1080 domain-containing protein [Sediminicola luteus]PCE64452.1 hypothetical protein B7P33_09195 [Sediminicola luteus]
MGKRIQFSVYLFITLCISINSRAQEAQKEVLFNGTDLSGWETVKTENIKFWKVVDGVITGGDGERKIPVNTYLVTKEKYADFEFRCLFRISGDHKTGLINSGIQYRSQIEHGNIIGYQADIGKGYWGDIYDEHRRGKLVSGSLEIASKLLKEEGWNSYIIRCEGNRHRLYINGVLTCEYEETNAAIPAAGVFGLQLHSGGKAKIEFKHVEITPL